LLGIGKDGGTGKPQMIGPICLGQIMRDQVASPKLVRASTKPMVATTCIWGSTLLGFTYRRRLRINVLPRKPPGCRIGEQLIKIFSSGARDLRHHIIEEIIGGNHVHVLSDYQDEILQAKLYAYFS